MMGTSKVLVSKLMNGRQKPSLEQIVMLADIFNVKTQDLVDLCIDESQKPSEIDKKLIEMYKKFPVSEFISKQWAGVTLSSSKEELVKALEPYYEDSITQNCQSQSHAKKTHPEKNWTKLQDAWVLRVRHLAKLNVDKIASFDINHIDKTIEIISNLMHTQADFETLFSVLNKNGIQLIIVECRGSKIDGVCTWLTPTQPVIGMTLRFNREDNFWFVLLHELIHVKQGFCQKDFIDDDLTPKNSEDLLETQANQEAQEICLPRKIREKIDEEFNGFYVDAKVKSFAKSYGVNTSVLAGQIRHKLNRYSILNKSIRTIRDDICRVAPIVDGWGYHKERILIK